MHRKDVVQSLKEGIIKMDDEDKVKLALIIEDAFWNNDSDMVDGIVTYDADSGDDGGRFQMEVRNELTEIDSIILDGVQLWRILQFALERGLLEALMTVGKKEEDDDVSSDC